MRARWMMAAGLAAWVGCGDNDLGVPRAILVADLSDEDAMALCDEFVALICGDVRGEEFCDACVLYELCMLPDIIATMRTQCEDVTVGEIRDCSHERLEVLCAPEYGGCMFDVGDWLCHPEGFVQ